MLILIHGDHQVDSRNHLHQLITSAKKTGISETIYLNGKTATQTDIIQAIETQSLFGTDKLIVIENLFSSRPKSDLKNQLIKYLSHTTHLPNTPEVILYETKILTPPQIKSLNPHQLQLFKINKVIFKFVESITLRNPKHALNLFHTALNQDNVEFIFAMIIRQIRLLIQIKQNSSLKLAPWQKNKLKSQARAFTTQQLLLLHRQLLEIDHRHKTGRSLSDLKTELDFILANI